MKRLSAILCAILLLGIHTNLHAQAFKTKQGKAKFTSEVPLHTFSGVSDYLVGKITVPDSTVDFYLDLSTLKTGIATRDKDMLETLNADEHPFAEFFGKLTSDFDPNLNERQPVTVKGTFGINGHKQTITVEGYIHPQEEGLLVEASWVLELDDYNIEPPGVLFYRVDSTQDIAIKALLKPVKN